MSYNIITLLLTIHCIIIHINAASDCFSSDKDDYKCRIGTRTPYRFIANYNDSQLSYPGYTVKKIWLLIRHGTRFPSTKDSSQMINVLPKLKEQIIEHFETNQSSVSTDAIKELIKWNLTLDIDDQMKLAEEGEREQVDLAERFQERFPDVLSGIYSNDTYRFKYTASQRTEESAKYFTIGLFGYNASQNVWYPEAEEIDLVLRSYKTCDRWQSEVNNNPAAYEEMNLFVNSTHVEKTLNEISERLGFRIDYDDLSVLYSSCGFETAWTENANSPWCKFLSLDNLKVMEYVEDLDKFWTDGYGYSLTYEQTCPTLIDVFQFFETESEQKATVYFSHSGTILKLLAHLGLAKDAIPLTHDSFELHQDTRAWRSSRIDAFATNIGFVLYESEEDEPSILVMHQEKVVQILGCPEDLPCPISRMKEIFAKSLYECNYEEMCKLTDD